MDESTTAQLYVGWTVANESIVDGVQYVTVFDEGQNPCEYNVTADHAEREYGLTLAATPYQDGHCGT